MIRFRMGDLQLTVLEAGRLWLDGGAMFGVVPRVLWERERPPDARHRIELAMNLLLVQDGRRNVLVDTGAGAKWDAKTRDLYGIVDVDPAAMLAPAGLRPDDIHVVVNTHLHFDHAGGNTARAPGGGLTAAYPAAEYVVQKGDLEVAQAPNERTRASYLEDDYAPLLADGRLRTVEGELSLFPWLKLRLAPGHTPWLQLPQVVTGEGSVLFLADLAPTTSHVRPAWIMGYDVEPLRTLESKKRLLGEAAREGHWLVFEHDMAVSLAMLEEENGKLKARSLAMEV